MRLNTENSGLFPAILASSVHDIKNSLSTLLELIRQTSVKHGDFGDDLNQLEFEAARINHSLMQLLVMYKIDSQKFSLAIDEHAVSDIICEAVDQQARLVRLNHIDLRVECDADMMCYCDYPNISNALAAVLNNALRYTRQAVLISAREDRGFVSISIEDDGEGYPPHFLNAELNNAAELDWVSGNTGLGLYFASAIAGLHKRGDVGGYVQVDNQSRLGGARFKLYLP